MNYDQIFEKRGQDYHDMMITYPEARHSEFSGMLEFNEINENDVILDIPCGGCYFHSYIPKGKIISVDSCPEFTKNCEDEVITCSLDDIDVGDEKVSIAMSLAGSHHLDDKCDFFSEVFRTLKFGGNFVYADVKEGSKEDKFLNGFVNEFNSQGHVGNFLNGDTLIDLEGVGFEIDYSGYEEYTWDFETEQQMVDFTKYLFGLDLADEATILKAIEDILGYESGDKVRMNWGLMYINSRKVF